ncbi:MAG: alpha/beta fold hydrolase [Prevotellaceae bacterium]|jgi:dipeptidyl aminopeptidase/acylaminoacyl peptidase|nr:alpha/beta fold hydrolase [Prevotellaceae bacterium]
MKPICLFIGFLLLIAIPVQGQTDENLAKLQKNIEALADANEHRLDILEKKIDDVLWFNRVGDVAFIDKVYITGPPRANVKNPTAMGAKNPLKFWSYVFIPKQIDVNKKYPLVVLVHGGVHGDFSTYHTHIVRELMAQGYIVVAPEYRGSTGYGQSFWRNIDYGGLEVQDSEASRAYMVENYSFVDKNKVGVVGWSHGGLIGLMSIFQYPQNYAVCFAGVPVSDLVARMGYHDDGYRRLFSADYHIGKTAQENVEEYRRRSPVWNVEKLQTPLLIHTNTNDDDVHVLEVETLIRALKAEGKKFEYEIFKDIAGGHSFDRIDTKQSREIRLKIWTFIAKYLNPPTPIKTLKDMEKAAYIMIQ